MTAQDPGAGQPVIGGTTPDGRGQDGTHDTGDSEPAVPAQAPEDTDAAWGEYPERDDDRRLFRDRPPHWDDF